MNTAKLRSAAIDVRLPWRCSNTPDASFDLGTRAATLGLYAVYEGLAIEGSGGALFNNSARNNLFAIETSSGGIIVDGFVFSIIDETGNGGFRYNGASIVNIIYNYRVATGIRYSGIGSISSSYMINLVPFGLTFRGKYSTPDRPRTPRPYSQLDNRGACYNGGYLISKATILASLPVQLRESISQLPDSSWSVSGFNKKTRTACVTINTKTGVNVLSVAVPKILSY